LNYNDDIRPLAAFTQIGHAFFARDGVNLAFGRRWDGQLIHISQADRGAACGCVCLASNCRRQLIARKPDSDVAHHFAHAPLTAADREAGVASKCEYGPMTALHEYAENLLNETKQLVLPPVEATLGKRTRAIRPAREFRFDAAALETMDGETIPDVILWKGESRMHVEIFVTHKCGPEKRAKITAANISAVEIDLSAVSRDITVGGLNDAILNFAPREWIHNRKAQEALSDLEAEEKAEAELIEQQRQQEIAELKQAYTESRQRALKADWKTVDEVERVIEAGDGGLLNGFLSGEGYFYVHPKVWKAAILSLLHSRFSNTTPGGILSELARRGWIVETFQRADLGAVALEADLPEGGPNHAIALFLEQLKKKGIAQDDGWRWAYTPNHASELDRRRMERERRAREAAERATRRKRLTDLATEIVSAGMPNEGVDFDFSRWVLRPINGIGRTAQEIVDEGSADWRELLKGLALTLAVLRDESEEVAQDFELPISDLLATRHKVHEERAEARKHEAEQTALKEGQGRADQLVRQAQAALGDDSQAWLDNVQPQLNGLTPRTAAAASVEKLWDALRFLEKCREANLLKVKWVNELQKEATSILRRPDMVALYMKSPDPELPNRVSPSAYTKDEETMRQCLTLLKRRSGKR